MTPGRGNGADGSESPQSWVAAPQLKALLDIGDVADLLSVSKAWVRDHATRRNPRIPVVRLGGRRAVLRFRLQDVERFIVDHLVSTERSV
jgi:hypothetical protein